MERPELGSGCAALGRPVRFRLFGRPGAGFSKSLPDMKTISAKPDSVRRDWYLVNAEGKTLGRVATALAYRHFERTQAPPPTQGRLL